MSTPFEIVYLDPKTLVPYEANAKKHDETQIRDLAAAISKRGFDQPITVDKEMVIITGHGRREAIYAGLDLVPVIIGLISTKSLFVRNVWKITVWPAPIMTLSSCKKSWKSWCWAMRL
jgi:ParB-like chromosome segregation protein Spo0J